MKNKIENVSIIMSVKNGEKYLVRAIESIINQSFRNFEFIIINNDSNDGSFEILENYKNKDSRIKILVNSNNETLYDGRTTGIKEAKFDWFALMDADDECHIDRIQKQVDFINNNHNENLAVVSTYGKYVDHESKTIAYRSSGPINLEDFKNMYSNNESFTLIDPSIIMKKKVFFELGGYLKNNIAADLDFFYRVAENGYLIQTINNPLYYYRIHETSYSIKNSMKQCEVTHFINFNMRQRRSGKSQITEKQFYSDYWSKFSYRMPRKILDYSKTYYKISTYAFAKKRYFVFLFNFIIASFFSPKFISKKIYQHLFKKD